MNETCGLCYAPIELHCYNHPCGHSSFCGECMVRQYSFYKHSECPLCNTKITKLILSTQALNEKRIPRFKSLIKTDLQNVLLLDEETKNVFDDLNTFSCSICYETFETMTELKKHLVFKHFVTFCSYCLENRLCFLSEQVLYSDESLELHYSGTLESEPGFKGHPMCNVCSKRFYDLEALLKHQHLKHHHCHLCLEDGKPAAFKQWKQLINHFKKSHFMCHFEDCQRRMAGLCVFSSDEQLILHYQTEHHLSLNEILSILPNKDLSLPNNAVLDEKVDNLVIEERLLVEREKMVIDRIKRLLNNDENEYEQFMSLCGLLYNGNLTTKEFLQEFSRIFGLFGYDAQKHFQALDLAHLLGLSIPDKNMRNSYNHTLAKCVKIAESLPKLGSTVPKGVDTFEAVFNENKRNLYNSSAPPQTKFTKEPQQTLIDSFKKPNKRNVSVNIRDQPSLNELYGDIDTPSHSKEIVNKFVPPLRFKNTKKNTKITIKKKSTKTHVDTDFDSTVNRDDSKSKIRRLEQPKLRLIEKKKNMTD
eukprot:TRINITY_DN2017_c0_g1_i1.p1 TRINITY_DN2017_c0_g1~~TRINITY_DN2017_c0_g1_i1.p1  ORF type:complete len:532 (+),score=133.82 TRINITY_DN2017_c0_g1_i1:91-1686(+)